MTNELLILKTILAFYNLLLSLYTIVLFYCTNKYHSTYFPSFEKSKLFQTKFPFKLQTGSSCCR